MSNIYCGKGKPSKFGLKLNICLSDIPPEHTTEFNGKVYVKIDLQELKSVDQKGNTHTLKIDTWKPRQEIENSSQESSNEFGQLPF